MLKPIITTLFSGCGGVDLGAIAAGYEPCESVEFDPQIAELHKANIGGKMHVKNILDCDPRRFQKVDLLHGSPVCKSYSSANTNKGEHQLDIDTAIKTAEFIAVLEPPIFTLENVQAYEKSKAFSIILEKLYNLGYWVNYQVLNAADFGVPQSRRRLILVALKRNLISDSDIIQSGDIRLVKNSLEKGSLININQLALFDTPKSLLFEFDHIPDVNDESLKYLFKQGFYAAIVNNKFVMIKGESVPSLPAKERHVGWYEAIADLVHDLPDSKLADWQLKALPKDILDHLLVSPKKKDGFHYTETKIERPVTRLWSEVSPCLLADMPLKAILMHGENASSSINYSLEDLPSMCVTASLGSETTTRAILLENTGARSDRLLQTKQSDEPCWTLRAMGQDGHYHRANALLIHPTDQRTMPVIEAPDPAFTLTGNQGGNHVKALLENAKIKALDIPCLARLQSFPDDYQWSGKKSVDGKGIGNSVCPLKYQKIIQSLGV